MQRHGSIAQSATDACPDLAWDRIETPHSLHLAKPNPSLGYTCPALAMNPDLIDEPRLIIDAGHIQSPLRMAIGVSDCTESSDDTEPEKQHLQLLQQSLTRRPEVDTHVP